MDFHGVKISEVAYSFDYDFAYIGFFARIAEREPFAGKESPQYIRDVYRDLNIHWKRADLHQKTVDHR